MKSSLPGIQYRCLLIATILMEPALAQERSVRFYGNGIAAPGMDRIKIPLVNSSPVNIINDFTIECWIKCKASENNGNVMAAAHGDGWTRGNIFIDRDVYGNGDFGDFGLSIGKAEGVPSNQRVVAFGIDRLGTGITLRGNINVADNNWHHIAVTRNAATGELVLYIDGQVDASGIGPIGNVNYNTATSTSYSKSNPFLVLGAEKHDAGTAYPSFNGLMDELRISTTIRYKGIFVPSNSVFTNDQQTAGLYHFNEGMGTMVKNSGEQGNADGEFQTGGSPTGPAWQNDSPFDGITPLEWLDLSVRAEMHYIVINWSSKNSIGASSFEIQRSADGNNFSTIGRMNTDESCTGICKYSFTDKIPGEVKNYYRVRHLATSGESNLSGIVSILPLQKHNNYKVYQNGSGLMVQASAGIESLVIWNSSGRRLVEKKNIREGITQLPLGNSKGFVFVHLNFEDGERATEKIMLR